MAESNPTRRYQKLTDRFWSKVDKNGDCWIWTASRSKKGYGRIGLGSRKEGVALAHRVAYELSIGPIPEGLDVLHSCDNPPCCNPGHLFLGTQQDNMADKIAKGRQPRGAENYRAQLTWEQVDEIRKRYVHKRGVATRLGREFGVHHMTIYRVAMGQIYKTKD